MDVAAVSGFVTTFDHTLALDGLDLEAVGLVDLRRREAGY